MHFTRYLKSQLKHDLQEKMVFIGGPRQVGKTVLAKEFIQTDDQYLTWDSAVDRATIQQNKIDIELKLLILDEIHKYARWRSLVKGLYDKYFPRLNLIVTGSARLDHFRKGGDSLVGRYHYLRLHPLSLRELTNQPKPSDLDLLLNFGGFPEPLKRQDAVHHRRWQLERIARVVTQDLTDLETVKEVSLVELLCQGLKLRVGSPLSIKSLQEDLQVSPHTVKRWIEILEKLYYCYRVYPYGPEKMKAIKKTAKLYLWDWSEVEDPGYRFENLVASQLLKFCHFQEDCLGLPTEIRYFKDVVSGREIDFVILQKGKPLMAIECKSGERQLAKHFAAYALRLKVPKIYQIHRGSKDFGEAASGRVLPFSKFCEVEGLP